MSSYDNVKFTKGTDIVYIATVNVDENIINPVKVITTPTTGDSPTISKLLNLNRIEYRYTVTGSLIYGKISGTLPIVATDTKTTAKDKKDLLKEMIAGGSVVVFTYEGENYNVAVEKLNIKDKAKDSLDSVDGEAVYDVIITCVYGEDIG